ncbi:hypothetical protein [Prevotella sp. HUN102]|uniref:hypothetical protein n=1 Tax=Prevotella sp. HUN102 TaxID=1392486 RepID=UPI00048B3A21|nr:hypothetical protein [Prevotella sp. HUN102]
MIFKYLQTDDNSVVTRFRISPNAGNKDRKRTGMQGYDSACVGIRQAFEAEQGWFLIIRVL